MSWTERHGAHLRRAISVCGVLTIVLFVVSPMLASSARAAGAGDAAAYGDPFRWLAPGGEMPSAATDASSPPVPVQPTQSIDAGKRLRLVGIVRHGARAVALVSSGSTTFLVREGQAVQPGDGRVTRIGDGVVTVRWPLRDARGEAAFVVQHLTFQEVAP